MTGKLALPTLIALCSIALSKPTLSSMAVLGEISISGTMIKVDELAKEEATAMDNLEQLIFRAENSKKLLDKDRRKEPDEAVKRAKKAVKQKNVSEMQDCAVELERLLPAQEA